MSGTTRDYYRAMHGRWRGELALSTAGWRWLRPTMSTTLSYGDEVLHTTALTWLGLPLFRSAERMDLAEDGRTGEMRGRVWVLGLPWSVGAYSGPFEADADARGVTYRFRILGASVVQTTRAEGEGALRVSQQLWWGRGDVLLRRYAADV